MEDDRRVQILAGQDEAVVLYLDSIVQIFIGRYGYEAVSDLFQEVTRHHTERADAYEWTAELRALIVALDSAVPGLLEHHKPIE